MAASLLADGASRFEELVFQSRYLHVNQFKKMGANVHMEGRTALVNGVAFLRSARLHCTDLRGGAALVIAALAAKGVSFIDELQHIYRGYDDMPAVIRQLGGKVWMISSGSIETGEKERKKEGFSNLGYAAGIPLAQTQGVL